MRRIDRQLVAAVVAPLLIWPWAPHWGEDYLKGGWASTFTLIVLAPILEETAFRGFLQGELLLRLFFRQMVIGVSLANMAASGVFAAAHAWQHPIVFVPGYFAVSLVLGHFRERYGGIAVPVLLHSYYNFGLWVHSN